MPPSVRTEVGANNNILVYILNRQKRPSSGSHPQPIFHSSASFTNHHNKLIFSNPSLHQPYFFSDNPNVFLHKSKSRSWKRDEIIPPWIWAITTTRIVLQNLWCNWYAIPTRPRPKTLKLLPIIYNAYIDIYQDGNLAAIAYKCTYIFYTRALWRHQRSQS